MLTFFADDKTLDSTLHQSQNIFRQIGDTFLNVQSMLILLCTLTAAFILGRIIAAGMRWFTGVLGREADKTQNLAHVNRLRRFETLIVLSIALMRTLLIALAIYFWWLFIHPHQQPTALIGASAVFAIIAGGILSPVLRDLAYGSFMMAEQWYGVGDHVRIEPFGDVQGVVERVTLRSTRIRGLNGEIIWLNNQSIAGVRISPKGIRTIALELFVSDIKKGLQLIETANSRLPSGPLLVVSPLAPMTTTETGNGLWHITAIGETAPGREWLLEQHALTVIKELDEKHKILLHDPIARYADSEAERRFARSINNARKQTIRRSPRLRGKRSKN